MVVTHKDEALSYYLIFKISNYQIMKKTYIIPVLTITGMSVENMIAQSIQTTNTSARQDAGMEVKSTVRVDYNVWDDDWSQ